MEVTNVIMTACLYELVEIFRNEEPKHTFTGKIGSTLFKFPCSNAHEQCELKLSRAEQ